jgi:CRISPR system Cascade subunit CasD
MHFLLFTHYAPMTAMGEIAPGERRMAFSRPARSAILGLVAAALGLDRGDARHGQLEDGLGYAVRTDVPGRPFTDYHTAQTPQHRRGQGYRTRRDELAAENLNTVLSVREWRSDALYTIVLWRRPGGAVELDAIRAALARPRFALYAGRKSAPFGLPLAPRLVEADSLIAAFASDPMPPEGRGIVNEIIERTRNRALPSAVEVAFDRDNGIGPDPAWIEVRRDGVVARARFHFRERSEGVVSLGGG